MPAAAFAARARRGRARAYGLWSGLSLHLLPVFWGLGAARLGVASEKGKKSYVNAGMTKNPSNPPKITL
jgi:hypothetical protein